MKYLAAYALLSLSGKKDICNFFSSSQPPLISKTFSEPPTAPLLTLISPDWSKLWKEKMWTNWLPAEFQKSEAQPQLQVQSQLPNKRKNNNPRNKHQRKKSNQRSKKKKTWDSVEDSSIDQLIVSLFHSSFLNPSTKFNHFHTKFICITFLYLWLNSKPNYNIFEKLKKI